MNIAGIPFHAHLGLEIGNPSAPYLVALPPDPKHANHLGTIHASVLIAVAEAASGVLLSRTFADMNPLAYLPMIHRVEAKFHQAARGLVRARAGSHSFSENVLETFKRKGRLKLQVPMEVLDAAGLRVMSAQFDWVILPNSASFPE